MLVTGYCKVSRWLREILTYETRPLKAVLQLASTFQQLLHYIDGVYVCAVIHVSYAVC